jgi:hypothetical protein
MFFNDNFGKAVREGDYIKYRFDEWAPNIWDWAKVIDILSDRCVFVIDNDNIKFRIWPDERGHLKIIKLTEEEATFMKLRGNLIV